MEFGVTVPNNWGIEDPQAVISFGPLAEELGYDSVWVMDHLFNNGYIRERLDDKPYYHPMATLSHISALTTRVRLGTSGNCSDLRGSADYSAYCGGATEHGISTANRFRPLKREQLPRRCWCCRITTRWNWPSMRRPWIRCRVGAWCWVWALEQ